MDSIGDAGGEVLTGNGMGTLAVFTHPAYCGFAGSAGEHVPAERRGLITWSMDGATVVGYANPDTPPGDWAFLHYFQSPDGPAVMRAAFDHPIGHRGGPKHVAPILCVGDTITAQVS